MLKAGSGKCPNKIYNIARIQESLTKIYDKLLFLRAMTGCDTTSALYRQGKKKAFNLLNKSQDLQKCAHTFYESNASTDSVTAAGEKFLLALYGATKNVLSLNQLRHHLFVKAVAKCPSHSNI